MTALNCGFVVRPLERDIKHRTGPWPHVLAPPIVGRPAPPTSGMPMNRTGAGGAPSGDSLGLDIFLRKCPNRMGP